MARKSSAVVLGFMTVGALFLLGVTASNVYAWGEGGHAPEGMHLKGPALQGTLTATYVSPDPSPYARCKNINDHGCVDIIFSVKCKNQSGVTFEVFKVLDKSMEQYTETDLENMIFAGAGPPACADGGEDLVVQQVFTFNNTFDPDNPGLGGIIFADMFLLYAVPYSANNPAQ